MRFSYPRDTAKLVERGYDSSVTAEAEKQLERRVVTSELCREIEAAFSGVRLGEGVGLWEAQAIDDYADAATRGAARAKDEKMDWRSIPARSLNSCNSSLSFFDALGMRFHLPAYLVADLRGEYEFGMAFCLTHGSDYRNEQFGLLNKAQRLAVRKFLLFIAHDRDYKFFRPDITRALERRWIDPDADQIQSQT